MECSRDLSRLTLFSNVSFSQFFELFKEYQEEAYTISLHPSGHYIVVGFADKLRIMNLLIDDIRLQGILRQRVQRGKNFWR